VKKLTTDQIVRGIRLKDNGVIKYLYQEYFPIILNFIKYNNGNTSDAEDVFQETLVVIYRNLREEKIEEIKEFEAYIFGISKYIWKRRFRNYSQVNEIPLDLYTHDIYLDESDRIQIETSLQIGLYQKHFLELEEEFKKVLQLYFAKIPMTEIAKVMGYSSAEYAKRKKYLAQQDLINRIRSDPDYHD